VAKKIGKKPLAAKSSVALAKRPAPATSAAKDLKKSAKPAAKAVVKPAPVKAFPVKAAKAPAKSVVAKVATAATAVVKPVAAVAKSAVAAVAKKPGKAEKYAPAEKSAVITAYAKHPSAVIAKAVEPVKKAPKPVEPVRLPPPPVRSDAKMAKNRAGLTHKEVEHFRDLLLEKRRELLGDVSSMETSALRSGNSNLSTLPMHMADSGTDNYEQEFTLGLVEKDRQLMREINVALAKIQDGSYGICEGTGKPISKPRLEAQPWARYSIEHARALEKPQFRRAF